MAKRKVTVLGRAQARIDYKFTFHGIPEACLRCEYESACLGSLEKDRIYTVKRVLGKVFPCPLRMAEGVLVEVEEAPVELLIRAEAAISGALFTYVKPDCPGDCENYSLCHPRGLEEGDRCLIAEVKGMIRCPHGVNLALVTVRRTPQPP